MDSRATLLTRTLFVNRRWLPPAGDHDVIGDVSPMLVLRLVCAAWRTYAALLFALTILVGLPGDAHAADVQVSIVQPGDAMTLRYEPTSQTVSVGTTVTWTNGGSTAITITSPDGLFDSETVQPGGSFSHTFDTPGTFRYF